MFQVSALIENNPFQFDAMQQQNYGDGHCFKSTWNSKSSTARLVESQKEIEGLCFFKMPCAFPLENPFRCSFWFDNISEITLT